MDKTTDRELLIRIDERVRNLEISFRDFKRTIAENYVKQGQFSKICADVIWMKRTYWVVATASIGGLIAGTMALLLK